MIPFAQALRTLLEADGRLEVVGTAAMAAVGVELAEALRQTVVLMDLVLPVMDGVEATHENPAKAAHHPVVGITGLAYEERALEVRNAGAVDFIDKSELGPDLVEIVVDCSARPPARQARPPTRAESTDSPASQMAGLRARARASRPVRERRCRPSRRVRRASCSGPLPGFRASWRPDSTMLPWSSTTIWSASRTVESRCAIAIVVRPAESRSSASWTKPLVSVSSELVASSRMRIGGLRRIVRAIAIRCFSPPEEPVSRARRRRVS